MEYPKLIHQIAQFLKQEDVLNKEDSLSSQITILHFFFKYGNQYSKEEYSNLSFELIESILTSEVIINTKNRNKFSFHGIGWGLMVFFKERFFEFDEFDEVLSIFDISVINSSRIICFSGFKPENTLELISLGIYLKERTNLPIDDDVKRLELKQVFFMVLYEIAVVKMNIIDNQIKLICNTFLLDCYKNSKASEFLSEILNFQTISKSLYNVNEPERGFRKVKDIISKTGKNRKKIIRKEINFLANIGVSMIRINKNLPISSFELFNQVFFKLT